MALHVDSSVAGFAATLASLLVEPKRAVSVGSGGLHLEGADGSAVTGDIPVLRAIARGAVGRQLLGDSAAAEAEVCCGAAGTASSVYCCVA